MSARSTFGQFWRYAAIGLISNVAIYAGYLLLTHVEIPSKLAMSLLYAVGVLQTYALNKRWSFQGAEATGFQFARYCLVYVAGYAVNLAGLFLFVDLLHWPHEMAQGILVFVVAVLLFVIQKFWIFRTPTHLGTPPSPHHEHPL